MGCCGCAKAGGGDLAPDSGSGTGVTTPPGGLIQPDPPLTAKDTVAEPAPDSEVQAEAEPTDEGAAFDLRAELAQVPAWLWIVLAVIALRWLERNL